MARRHHYKRRKAPAYEIDVTTFLNLMVVLIPFLLITAVFSQLTIVELNLPSSASGPQSEQEGFTPEIIVREAGIEITNGKQIIATIPNKATSNSDGEFGEDEFDLETLSDYMVELKRTYPQQEAASVLMEAQIPYDYLIQVMDIVKRVEVPIETENGEEIAEGEPQFELVALFSDISVGDAP
jgi:biopolymer transport protein ExbD